MCFELRERHIQIRLDELIWTNQFLGHHLFPEPSWSKFRFQSFVFRGFPPHPPSSNPIPHPRASFSEAGGSPRGAGGREEGGRAKSSVSRTRNPTLEHARAARAARAAGAAAISSVFGVIGCCSDPPPSTRAGGQDDVSSNKLPQIMKLQ